jgi:hypothetical protein
MKHIISFSEFINEGVKGDLYIQGLSNTIADELGVKVIGTITGSGNEDNIEGIKIYNVANDYNMQIDFALLSKSSKKSIDELKKIIDKAIKNSKKTIGNARVKTWSPDDTTTVYSVSA